MDVEPFIVKSEWNASNEDQPVLLPIVSWSEHFLRLQQVFQPVRWSKPSPL